MKSNEIDRRDIIKTIVVGSATILPLLRQVGKGLADGLVALIGQQALVDRGLVRGGIVEGGVVVDRHKLFACRHRAQALVAGGGRQPRADGRPQDVGILAVRRSHDRDLGPEIGDRRLVESAHDPPRDPHGPGD